MTLFAVADAVRLPLADRSVDLVFGSPPYCDARTYGIGADRDCSHWIEWMYRATWEALRVSPIVVWVAAGVTRQGCYQPACEGLIWRMWEDGINTLRPCIWTKNAPPTGHNWYSNCWEFVMAFGKPPHFDVSEIATQLKYKTGGAFRQRTRSGKRNHGSAYPQHKIRRTMPNVINVPVGGGLLGHPLAHENEAPFPEKLAEFFIRSLCLPGGIVLDPFSGSGTTVSVALQWGRRGIGLDIRPSQARIGTRRCRETKSLFNEVPE